MDTIEFEYQSEILEHPYRDVFDNVRKDRKGCFYFLAGLILFLSFFIMMHVYYGTEAGLKHILVGCFTIVVGIGLFFWVIFTSYMLIILISRIRKQKRNPLEIIRFIMDQNGLGFQTRTFRIYVHWQRIYKWKETDKGFWAYGHQYFRLFASNIPIYIPKDRLSPETIGKIQELAAKNCSNKVKA